jgi:predicted acetyltransferase
MMAVLVRPSADYKDSFIEAVREFQAENNYLEYDIEHLTANFDQVVQEALNRLHHPRPRRVPETIYWLVEADTYIGRVGIRHELNDQLRLLGGHIGYDIRPSKRRRGYGTFALKLALVKVHDLGIRQALITCDATNIGSRKIIEANGGRLHDEIMLKGRTVATRRYWIDI